MSEKRVFLVRPQAHIRGQMSAATWTKLPADGLRKKMKDHSHSLAWQERKHMTHLSLGHASLQTITKNSREHNRL